MTTLAKRSINEIFWRREVFIGSKLDFPSLMGKLFCESRKIESALFSWASNYRICYDVGKNFGTNVD